ncbi:hypothetical protein [Rhodobacter capsulatus]|nr:hypothetical protein [Rhodobacter capsulatus]
MLKADVAAQMAALPRAADADARLVARMIALLEEAMEIARSRSGAEGQAMIDTLAVDIFRVISNNPTPGAAEVEARGRRAARRGPKD